MCIRDRGIELNPREVLFEKIPKAICHDNSGDAVFENVTLQIEEIKKYMDNNLVNARCEYETAVRQLVNDSGFPNMKVLEFAFDSRDSSGPRDYLPYNYDKNCVVYTGTHDNETLKGWLDSIEPEEIEMIQKYIGRKVEDKSELVDEIIRMAQASTAKDVYKRQLKNRESRENQSYY